MSDHPPYLTIVSGLPRSGTSLMMRMLETGGMPVLVDHIRRPDDDNPNGYYEFEPVKTTRKDASWVVGAEGKAVKMVYRLLYDLPPSGTYRVLFMRRNLDEVLASQRVMLARESQTDDVDDAQMSALFRSELSRFETWLQRQENFSSLDVDYNALVAKPQPLVAQINQFLGGTLNAEAMCSVVDQSLYRNRR